MGIRLKKNKFALSSEMVIIAVTTLFLMTTTITAATQQSVYAQPQQPKGQGACPEGFELNRGVCQAEPERTCEPYGYHPARVELTEDGQQCKIAVTAQLPLCEEGEYDWWHNQCESPVGFEANFPTENQNIYCDGDRELVFIHVDWVCATYEYYPVILQCDVGSLNEESEMCELKPGRSSSRA